MSLDALAEQLKITELPEDELFGLEQKAIEGSCEWLLESSTLQAWRETKSRTQSRSSVASGVSSVSKDLLWLSGPPGSGKSVAAALLARSLNDEGCCSTYFFGAGNRASGKVHKMICSLAYQMALTDSKLRQLLFSLCAEGQLSRSDDARMTWKQLFQTRILRTSPSANHFWVLDAADECPDANVLAEILGSIPVDYPLKVFVTSTIAVGNRLERLLRSDRVAQVYLSESTNGEDIRNFIMANSERLPLEDDFEAGNLVETLVAKSAGSFLWIDLVLQRLEFSFSAKAVVKAIDEVPEDMEKLYFQFVQQMEQDPAADIARLLLRWVVCAVRPLSLAELREALSLDYEDKIYKLERVIETTAGRLLRVDEDRVQLRHGTVRKFLLDSANTLTFAVDKGRTHARLAHICLQYLCADEANVNRGRRRGSAKSDRVLYDYAATNFSHHLARASGDLEETIDLLESFLNSSLLRWIEFIASNQDLVQLTHTCRNLKAFIDKAALPPMYTATININAWCVDLIRVATGFGRQLRVDSSAIHRLIPPLCPPSTALFVHYGESPNGLQITGLSDTQWSDRVVSTSHSEDSCRIVTCTYGHYAVGLRSGQIRMYDMMTCQETLRLDQQERINCLEFSNLGDVAATGGKTSVTVWEVSTGTILWNKAIGGEVLVISFDQADSVLFVATRKRTLKYLSLHSGEESGSFVWSECSDHPMGSGTWPTFVSLSGSNSIMAVVYRNEAPQMWDIEDRCFLGCLPTGANRISAVAFNEVSDFDLVAVAGTQGIIATFDPWTMKSSAMIEANASRLVVSTDGKTMLAGNKFGEVLLLDYGALHIFHKLRVGDEGILSMAFMPHNHRFVVANAYRHSVWEPAALFRGKEAEDSSSEGLGQSDASRSVYQDPTAHIHVPDDDLAISALTVHHADDIAFIGRENGQVTAYSTQTGGLLRMLYKHNGEVSLLHWSAHLQVLASAGAGGRVMAHRIYSMNSPDRRDATTWNFERLFEHRFDEVVRQILMSRDGKHLLIGTVSTDTLWDFDGHCVRIMARKSPQPQWSLSPIDDNVFFDPSLGPLRSFDLRQLRSEADTQELDTEEVARSVEYAADRKTSDVRFIETPQTLIIVYKEEIAARELGGAARALIWQSFDPGKSASPSPYDEARTTSFAVVAPTVKALIGVFREHLVFLDQNSWICSLALGKQERGECRKHFLIPQDWLSNRTRMIADVTQSGELVVAKDDEIAVFWGGLHIRGV